MGRIVVLDFYRFIAALGVVLYHIPFIAKADRGAGLGYATREFDLFVDFFFVLSGFVLGRNYFRISHKPRQIFRFLQRRVARIYPLYLATLLLFIAPATFLHPDRYNANSIVAQLLMVQQWQVNPPLPANFPAWSISAEWAMYLLFPFAVILARQMGSWILLLISAMGALLLAALLVAGEMHHPIWSALRAIPTFFVGVLISQMTHQILRNGTIVGAFVFSATIASMVFIPWTPTIVAGFCLTILLTSQDQAPPPIFSSPLLAMLGDISYTIYMLHAAVLSAAFKVVTPETWVGIAASLVTIILAVPTYYLFERPAKAMLSPKEKLLPASVVLEDPSPHRHSRH